MQRTQPFSKIWSIKLRKLSNKLYLKQRLSSYHKNLLTWTLVAGLTKVLELMDAKAAKLQKSEDSSTIVKEIRTNAALLSKWVLFSTLSKAACLKWQNNQAELNLPAENKTGSYPTQERTKLLRLALEFRILLPCDYNQRYSYNKNDYVLNLNN